jgi:glycosyltransferase involved in cell wall biosynthesis
MLPHFSFVLVGPKQARVPRKIETQPTFHFLGSRPYADIPSYIKGFDVCMIPFKLNRLTQTVDPVKLYEYMATGKPVVTVALPEIKRHGLGESLVLIARTNEDFVTNLKRATSSQETSDQHVAARVAFAGRHSWAHRGLEAVSIINNYLQS